jgi:hypothetical protein
VCVMVGYCYTIRMEIVVTGYRVGVTESKEEACMMSSCMIEMPL